MKILRTKYCSNMSSYLLYIKFRLKVDRYHIICSSLVRTDMQVRCITIVLHTRIVLLLETTY